MPDPRFFPPPSPTTLGAVADLTGALPGPGADPGRILRGVAPIDAAGPEDAAFLSDRKSPARLLASAAGVCFATPAVAEAAGGAGPALLIHDAPRLAFVRLARHLYPPARPQPGISPAAHVDPGATLGPGCRVEPGAVIGAGAEIGAGSWIEAGAVIGPGVATGPEARIGPRAVLTHALLGARVVVHAGAAIGQDGFGYVPGPAGLERVPQLGRVVIGDDVEIGANTCIDRGAGDDTTIGDGTKIDNLVQIAHNCRIGRHCVLTAHVGLSGSVTVGDGAQLGGKAGIADHIRIGAGARIAANAGLMHDVPDGATYAGSPAKPARQFFREMALLARLRTRDAENR